MRFATYYLLVGVIASFSASCSSTDPEMAAAEARKEKFEVFQKYVDSNWPGTKVSAIRSTGDDYNGDGVAGYYAVVLENAEGRQSVVHLVLAEFENPDGKKVKRVYRGRQGNAPKEPDEPPEPEGPDFP